MYQLPEINLYTKVSSQEWQTRLELAACYRLLTLQGWDDLIHTHISARIPQSEQ